MFERLREIQEEHKDKKHLEEVIKQAIESKKRSIHSKERFLELIDMIIINRVNMVEEIQFVEKRHEISKSISMAGTTPADRLECNMEAYMSPTVSDLVKFFNSPIHTQTCPKEHTSNR